MATVLPQRRCDCLDKSSWGTFADAMVLEDGTVRFCAPVSGDTLADWVDPAYDIGVFAAGKLSSSSDVILIKEG